jgi:hypothetical protein
VDESFVDSPPNFAYRDTVAAHIVVCHTLTGGNLVTRIFEMSISINCPRCAKSYKVTQKHIGRKVVCSNPDCQNTFIAELPLENDVVDDAPFEGFGASADIPQPPQPPPSRPAPAIPSAPTLDIDYSTTSNFTKKELPCYFGAMARILFYPGLLTLLTSMRLPDSSGDMFNAPLAMNKLSVSLLGMALLISGAAIWSGGNKSPRYLEVWFVSMILIAALVSAVMADIGR